MLAAPQERGGRRAMGWYKVYFLDEKDKIASVDNIECADDAAARKLAQAALADRPHYPAFELWQGQRRLEKFHRNG
jgi:hypothetical protein